MSTSIDQSPAEISTSTPQLDVIKPGADIPYSLFLDCVHCGLCTASCPTYAEKRQRKRQSARANLSDAVGNRRPFAVDRSGSPAFGVVSRLPSLRNGLPIRRAVRQVDRAVSRRHGTGRSGAAKNGRLVSSLDPVRTVSLSRPIASRIGAGAGDAVVALGQTNARCWADATVAEPAATVGGHAAAATQAGEATAGSVNGQRPTACSGGAFHRLCWRCDVSPHQLGDGPRVARERLRRGDSAQPGLLRSDSLSRRRRRTGP